METAARQFVVIERTPPAVRHRALMSTSRQQVFVTNVAPVVWLRPMSRRRLRAFKAGHTHAGHRAFVHALVTRTPPS